MKKIGFMICIAACCVMLGGCRFPGIEQEEPPVCGGTTDNTNVLAPKTIKSKDIVSYYANFYVGDEYDDSRRGTYTFEIEKDDQGREILTARGRSYKYEMEMTKEDLAGVQEIIDKYELAKINGTDRVTAGLPPECGPSTLDVRYESGESLYFHCNSGIDDPWAVETKKYFESLLIRDGHDDLKPPAEAMTIERFSFEFNVDNLAYTYCELTREEDQKVLWRIVYDLDRGQEVGSAYAEITDDLYAGMQEVIEAYGIDSLHAPDTVTFHNAFTSDGFLNIYVDYESGRQIYAEYDPESLPAEWGDMREALQTYMDSYIETHMIEE